MKVGKMYHLGLFLLSLHVHEVRVWHKLRSVFEKYPLWVNRGNVTRVAVTRRLIYNTSMLLFHLFLYVI